MIYIFPDTNIFIHGKHFEEIDWLAVTSEADVTIMLAPSVIAELDKHKYNPIKKVSQRARKLLPRIEEILKNPAECKWKFSAILRRPSGELFEQHHLDSKDLDDVLLATVLKFNAGMTKGDQSIIITNDTGPRLKSSSLQVRAIPLPDEYMAPLEPDETEKQLSALKRELEQHKNKTPDVSLLFDNTNKYLEVVKPFDVISEEEYVSRQMEKIRDESPTLIYREDNTMILPNLQRISIPLFNLKEEQVNDYNKELEEFYSRYEKYFASEYLQMIFLHNCCKVSLVIRNTGSAPAQDLDIHMHFPDGFDVIEKDSIPDKAKKPAPPYKPKNAIDFRMPMAPLDGISSLLHRTYTTPDLSAMNANVGGLDIKKTNSYDVKVHVRAVKHNQTVELEPLWLKYEDMRIAKGFTLDYQIMAANIPQVVTGKLNVNFIDDPQASDS